MDSEDKEDRDRYRREVSSDVAGCVKLEGVEGTDIILVVGELVLMVYCSTEVLFLTLPYESM